MHLTPSKYLIIKYRDIKQQYTTDFHRITKDNRKLDPEKHPYLKEKIHA